MMQSNKIRGAYPMHVDEIVLENGDTLKDKTVIICGDFVLVESENGAPSMYNSRIITALKRVREIRPEVRVSMW